MMENKQYPNITSFMIRFIEEGSTNDAGEPVYRGSIRHIQSDRELAFTCWQDALRFIEQYVPIQDVTGFDNSNMSAGKPENFDP
jgi:hypothetical protein